MNAGSTTLAGIIKRRGATQRDIALESGLDAGKLSRILSGKAVPNRLEAVALRDHYGIDPGEWDRPAVDESKGAA